jgi:glycosyltransferase involved in cell wall biosynthesis
MTADLATAHQQPRVAFVWHGLPAYGAHLIRGAIDTNRAAISVVATRPPFPVAPVDHILPHIIQWHDARHPIPWSRATEGMPDLAIVTGWGFPFCQRLAREAAAAGVPVVMMSDNRWRGDFRQWCGKLLFPILFKNRFRGAWVPGASGGKLLREFGMQDEQIFTGLYGCNPAVFRPAVPLSSRGKKIVFVGKMDARKGVDILIKAFSESGLAREGWELQTFGSGPLSHLAAGQPGVRHHDFSPPDVISRAVGDSRIFVMPSRDDNWPIALHEGAASGCLLLTTTAVGSCNDLIGPANGVVVEPGDAPALATGLRSLAAIPSSQLPAAEAESLAKAGGFGPGAFAASFERICDQFLPALGHDR